MKKGNSGFSQLELLIAVAILAILILAGLGGAQALQRRARVMDDLQNLRQIGVGALQFITENKGKLPAVMGQRNGQTIYAHELIGEQLGITTSFRANNVPSAKVWGPFISLASQRKPHPSPLQCYGVNFYMGEIFTLLDSRIARRYAEVNQPSKVIYFFPVSGDSPDPNSQARVSDLSPPIKPDSTFTHKVRFDDGRQTPVLWGDGRASMVTLEELRADFGYYLFPKRAR